MSEKVERRKLVLVEDEGTEGKITQAEAKVAKLVANGLSNGDIAEKLELSDRTIQVHLQNLFKKTQTNSRTACVVVLMQQGIIKLEDLEVEIGK